MPENHLKFHSANGKRQLLIIEDEMINRELLRVILSEQYELLFAEDGNTGLRKIKENKDTLSLVLLDLNLPDMHGLDVLKQIKSEEQYSRLPVIVMTAEKEAEVALRRSKSMNA